MATSETKRRRGSGNSSRQPGGPAVEPSFMRRSPLAILHSAYGNQAVLRFLQSSRVSPTAGAVPGVLQRKCACGGAGGDCAECRKKEETGLQRSPAGGARAAQGVPPIVHEVLRTSGQPLDRGTRAFMEPRFRRDFGDVRIHTDTRAANSARAVNALAYTVGRDVVFGTGGYRPATIEGQRLLAHELTHVIQQGTASGLHAKAIGSEDDALEREAEQTSGNIVEGKFERPATKAGAPNVLRRTPAGKVSCAPGPLHLPNGSVIDDPVGVITAAENRGNELLDQAIEELDFTRKQILGGAAIAFPTVSDALALGLRLMGLDPNSERVWKQTGGPGNYTAELLLRRLRLIRGTIGAGSFFFTCLGPANGTIGSCAGPICAAADAASCAGSFLVDLCAGFWQDDAEGQANAIVHESAHNFAEFIGASGEIGRGQAIAACYARFAQVVGGSNVPNQRPDLCPDPT